MKELEKRVITSALLLLILFLSFQFNYLLTFILSIFLILSSIEFIKIINKIYLKKMLLKYFYFLLGLLYITFFFILFIMISFGTLGGKFLILSFLLTCIASDIGGFIFGKIFKGKKLTKVSPNKTISGSIGSFILSIVTLNILFLFKIGTGSLDLERFLYNAILAFFISLGCQVGDLFISYLKRKAKIKDTGKLLPGHGGILDRIDGMLLGIPIGFLAIILI